MPPPVLLSAYESFVLPADPEADARKTQALALSTDTAYKAVPFIETYTGRSFHPLEPDVEKLSVIDIAHALANQCRYSGHVAWFYSTAQHCVLLAQYVLDNGGSALEAMQILMHDAAEAYLVDIPRPVKQFMPEYRKWDHAINVSIREWLGWSGFPIPTYQDDIDSRVIVDERHVLMSKSPNDWGHRMAPIGVPIIQWSQEYAERMFLIMFARLSREVYGQYLYVNSDWNIPLKVLHETASDSAPVFDIIEADIIGGVGRVEIRGGDGIRVRDPKTGFPQAQWEWRHGKFTVEERA